MVHKIKTKKGRLKFEMKKERGKYTLLQLMTLALLVEIVI